VKADVTWDPDGVEFKVDLILGSKKENLFNLYNSLPSVQSFLFPGGALCGTYGLRFLQAGDGRLQ